MSDTVVEADWSACSDDQLEGELCGLAGWVAALTCRFLLAVAEYEETGEVAGYVTLFMDQDSRIGWIHNLAVDAGLRGQGLGRRLIEHALDHFRASGMTVARIETLDQNSVGQHLYPSVGFQEIARQIHFAMPLESRTTDATETDSKSGTT